MTAPRFAFPLLLASAVALPPFLPSALQQNVKLNDTLALGCYGDVRGPLEFSPDAMRIVYLAEADTFELIEIYSAPSDGRSAPVKLNGPLAGFDIPRFEIASDSSRVVYVAQQNTVGLDELFSVPIDGGTPTRLHGDLVEGGEVIDFRITADAATVVYLADQDVDTQLELYSVPIDGGADPIRISGPLGASADVLDFVLSADSSRAAYRADPDIDSVLELFSTPIDGSAGAVKLNDDAVSAGGVTDDYAVSADSSRVVFRSDLTTSETFELHSAPIDGSSAAVQLNATLVMGGDVAEFEVSGDSTRVAYRADQDTDEVFEAYSVPIDASAGPVRLNAALVAGGGVYELAIGPDSSRVAFRADQDVAGEQQLYSVPLDGSAAPLVLTPVLVFGGDVLPGFQLSPDSTRAVYRADQDTNNQLEIYSVPLDGIQLPVKLNGALVAGGDVRQAYGISADSTRVVYLADQETDQTNELFSSPITGGANTRLNAELPAGGELGDFRIGPDSTRVAYTADQDTNNLTELYTVPLDGSAAPVKLNGLLVEGPFGAVLSFEIVAGGESVVYLADQDTNGVNELYRVPIDGGASSERLSAALQPDGDVTAFAVTPDGERVVYRADQDTNDVVELYSVPLLGGTPIRLNAELVEGGFVRDFALSADSSRVVYLAVQDTDGTNELYSAPVDGSQTSVRLNATLPAGGDVLQFALSPDASRAVYRADQDINNIFELYSVPTDGSAAPVKLHGSLSGSRDVRIDFQIAPDSGRVVYRADQNTNDVAEIYSTALDGSSPSVRLNGPLIAGGNVMTDFRISPDSSRVAYRADHNADEVFEAYAAPLDGSAAAVRVSGPLVNDGDVIFVGFSADSSRVLYLADQLADEVDELFSVPADASASPIKLSSTPLVVGGAVFADFESFGDRVVYHAELESTMAAELYSRPVDGSLPEVKLSAPLPVGFLGIGEFDATPNSRTVVYSGAQEIPAVRELFQVPIDGSAPPVKLHPDSLGDSGVRAFAIALDGSRVVYRADQETLLADELFRSLFQPELLAVAPSTGPATGGNTITLTGQGFADTTAVFFGGRPASAVTFVSESELRVVVPQNLRIPPPLRGPVQGKLRRVVLQGLDVDVTLSNGAFTSTLADGYTYLPRL